MHDRGFVSLKTGQSLCPENHRDDWKKFQDTYFSRPVLQLVYHARDGPNLTFSTWTAADLPGEMCGKQPIGDYAVVDSTSPGSFLQFQDHTQVKHQYIKSIGDLKATMIKYLAKFSRKRESPKAEVKNKKARREEASGMRSEMDASADSEIDASADSEMGAES